MKTESQEPGYKLHKIANCGSISRASQSIACNYLRVRTRTQKTERENTYSGAHSRATWTYLADPDLHPVPQRSEKYLPEERDITAPLKSDSGMNVFSIMGAVNWVWARA
jgi:hypothetical protein